MLSAASALRTAAPKPRASIAMRGSTAVTKQWHKYLKALEERPMPTKMATAAVLSGAGDVIAQCIERSGIAPAARLRRLLTLVVVNVLYIVPILTIFYAANERLTDKLELRKGWPRTGFQLAFDQLVNA